MGRVEGEKNEERLVVLFLVARREASLCPPPSPLLRACVQPLKLHEYFHGLCYNV